MPRRWPDVAANPAFACFAKGAAGAVGLVTALLKGAREQRNAFSATLNDRLPDTAFRRHIVIIAVVTVVIAFALNRTGRIAPARPT
jgi:hypothetical protein